LVTPGLASFIAVAARAWVVNTLRVITFVKTLTGVPTLFADADNGICCEQN